MLKRTAFTQNKKHLSQYKSLLSAFASPDFAELDVFLGQHLLLTLEQHFNQDV